MTDLIAQAVALCKAAERMQETSNRFHVALGNCEPLGEELQLDEETAQMEYSEAYSAVSKAVYYMHKAIRAQAAEQPAEAVACQYAKDVGMPEYKCVNKCMYGPDPRIAQLEGLLREAAKTLRQAKVAIKGREHTGFIDAAIERIEAALGGR